MDSNSRIYVAGHRGMVGSSIIRKLENEGYTNIIKFTRQEFDLTDSKKVEYIFRQEKPEYVFLAAAKVGGIMANIEYPAEFIYENLVLQTNVIHQSYLNKVKKLLFLGSSCIYPFNAPQPIKGEYLLSGPLEPTNEFYALAKIAGIKMCQAYNKQYETNYISVMPTNLYGPNDNFDLKSSHVVAALIRKFHDAKNNDYSTVEVWGSGKPRREFLHVDDLADACYFLMLNYDENEIINIGFGEDIAIIELAQMIKSIVDYKGDIVLKTSMPDGTARKLLDSSKLSTLGWKPSFDLISGIKKTYQWYLEVYI